MTHRLAAWIGAIVTTGLCLTPAPGLAQGPASAPTRAAQVAADLPAPPAPDPADAEYQALLARLKQADRSVDFLRLRRAFADSSAYRPYADSREEAMLDAIDANEPARALEIARTILDGNYLNIEAHFAGTVACSALKDAACASQHQFVAQGMLNSIAASGDGRSPESAFAVVNTPEEYAIARVMGTRVLGQAATRTPDGHVYDVLTIEDRRTGEERRIYFNVDRAMAAMAKLLARQ